MLLFFIFLQYCSGGVTALVDGEFVQKVRFLFFQCFSTCLAIVWGKAFFDSIGKKK
jgi:hypothetical protein